MENPKGSPMSLTTPQVKICGLTRVDEAVACAELGAAAIGFVFYPRSPRFVTVDQAREIAASLPPEVCTVGVFVNEPLSGVMERVKGCGLKAVQLHGVESPEMVEQLAAEGVKVVKAVFINGKPSIESASLYRPAAYLIECAGGPLPGGNAMAWDWSAAMRLPKDSPVIVAGGLDSLNVADAIRAASPDALDVSSGVEASPGRKDLQKVKQFLESVSRHRGTCRNVFR
ncbi:MAG: phosphoribosylanthranilate isomerase [Acidobacteriota bacterium]